MTTLRALPLLTLLLAAPAVAVAQDPVPLAVGDSAPDFTLPAATKHGVSQSPLRLRDLRDQTVIIAFFYQARTKG